MRRVLSASISLLFTASAFGACITDDKGDEDDELGAFDDIGKGDTLRTPTDHGAVTAGTPATSRLTAANGFHAWDFTVYGAAAAPVTLQLGPQTTGGAEVDTVLYLYRQKADGTWGAYIARNDDAGDSYWSALAKSLTPGHYRLVVKGYKRTTYGKFAVALGCGGDACSEPAPLECAFGATPTDITWPRFVRGGWTALSPGANFSATEQAQIVRALQASSHTDVTTVAEAFAAADGGVINRQPLRDDIAIRTYYFYEYGAGDNSYGAIFPDTSTTPAAEVHDGDIAECVVPPQTCVFGARFGFDEVEGLTVGAGETLTAASGLDAATQAQLIAAGQRYAPTVTTAASLFAAVTDGEVVRTPVTSAATGRAYTFITYILGDHRFGLGFEGATTTPAVEINDNIFERCAAF